MDDKNNRRRPQQERIEWTKDDTAEMSGPRQPRPVVRRAPDSRPAARTQNNGRAPYDGRAQYSDRARYGGQAQYGGRTQYAVAEQQERPKWYMTLVKYVVLALLLAVMVTAAVVLIRLKLLPLKYMAIICAMLLVLFGIVLLLVHNPLKHGRFTAGVIVACILAVGLLIGSFAGIKGAQTLQTIMSPNYTSAHVGVYVRADSGYQSLEELEGKSFGIMATLGREDTDEAINNLNETLHTTIFTQEVGGPTALVSALFDGSVDAVLMDSAFLEGLADVEEYKGYTNQMVEVTNLHVQRLVTSTMPPVNDEPEGEIFTVYISGIDSRDGLVSSSLSDVNIIVTVNTATRQVLMVSTPRDYFVPFSNTGEQDKLTHAGWYGVDTCMKTLGQLYDIDIDYYFRLNFEGFVEIIDALGGITVDSEYDFTNTAISYYGQAYYHFTEGENYLNGDQALAFARERKAFDEGDRQRGKNQMAVIRAVAKKAMSPELLHSYSELLDAVEGSFETTIPYNLIASLIRQQLDEGGDWNITSYSANGEGTYAVTPMMGVSEYVMEPDMETVETAKELMRQVRDGEIVTVP